MQVNMDELRSMHISDHSRLLERLELIAGSAFLVQASVSHRIESKSASNLFMVGVPGIQARCRSRISH